MVISAGPTPKPSRRRIGRYVVTEQLGSGGMGRVYRGYDEALDREVAVKVLTSEGTLDDERRRRFEIEARAAAKLQHPNIVTVFELGEDRGVPFIAMELLPGVDLEALRRSGEELLLQEELEVLVQVCRGLQYAHERRVVHRDIKPSNVRVMDDGIAKIMDFGIAKLADSGMTQAGFTLGTVHYMSPEQIQARPLDGRTDVFAVGVILYELLAGRKPFSGEGPAQVVYQIVHEPAPPLPAGLGDFGERLQAVVSRALAKDAGERYPSAGRLADDLVAILQAHVHTIGRTASPEAFEVLAECRRMLKEGRAEESVGHLEPLVAANLLCLEARRLLREAKRQAQGRQRLAAPLDDFAELDATFQPPASPTVLVPLTPPGPTAVPPAEPTVLAAPPTLLLGRSREPQRLPPAATPRPGAQPVAGGRPAVWIGAVGALALALSAAVLVSRRNGSEPSAQEATPPEDTAAVPTTLAGVALAAITIASEPAGATVSLDGEDQPGRTPIVLQMDPAKEHRLLVSLEGHVAREERLDPGRFPSEIRVKLERQAPPGTVNVESAYPVDVLWRGSVVSRGRASSQISLPAGRQVILLVSSAYGLRATQTVDVRAGQAAVVRTPPLGKIHIKANPDNCRVFLDGTFLDYPPILDRAVVAGEHTVAFQWPDGRRTEETVQVSPNAPTYVMGRRD